MVEGRLEIFFNINTYGCVFFLSTVVNCLNPHVPNAIKISGTSGPYNLNSVVRFVCPTGTHVLNGSDTIKCNQNSEWEPAPPRCLGKSFHIIFLYK